ncbi:MAG: GTPase [Nitrososphaerales archaeon]
MPKFKPIFDSLKNTLSHLSAYLWARKPEIDIELQNHEVTDEENNVLISLDKNDIYPANQVKAELVELISSPFHNKIKLTYSCYGEQFSPAPFSDKTSMHAYLAMQNNIDIWELSYQSGKKEYLFKDKNDQMQTADSPQDFDIKYAKDLPKFNYGWRVNDVTDAKILNNYVLKQYTWAWQIKGIKRYSQHELKSLKTDLLQAKNNWNLYKLFGTCVGLLAIAGAYKIYQNSYGNNLLLENTDFDLSTSSKNRLNSMISVKDHANSIGLEKEIQSNTPFMISGDQGIDITYNARSASSKDVIFIAYSWVKHDKHSEQAISLAFINAESKKIINTVELCNSVQDDDCKNFDVTSIGNDYFAIVFSFYSRTSNPQNSLKAIIFDISGNIHTPQFTIASPEADGYNSLSLMSLDNQKLLLFYNYTKAVYDRYYKYLLVTTKILGQEYDINAHNIGGQIELDSATYKSPRPDSFWYNYETVSSPRVDRIGSSTIIVSWQHEFFRLEGYTCNHDANLITALFRFSDKLNLLTTYQIDSVLDDYISIIASLKVANNKLLFLVDDGAADCLSISCLTKLNLILEEDSRGEYKDFNVVSEPYASDYVRIDDITQLDNKKLVFIYPVCSFISGLTGRCSDDDYYNTASAFDIEAQLMSFSFDSVSSTVTLIEGDGSHEVVGVAGGRDNFLVSTRVNNNTFFIAYKKQREAKKADIYGLILNTDDFNKQDTFSRNLILALLSIVALSITGFFGYRYLKSKPSYKNEKTPLLGFKMKLSEKWRPKITEAAAIKKYTKEKVAASEKLRKKDEERNKNINDEIDKIKDNHSKISNAIADEIIKSIQSQETQFNQIILTEKCETVVKEITKIKDHCEKHLNGILKQAQSQLEDYKQETAKLLEAFDLEINKHKFPNDQTTTNKNDDEQSTNEMELTQPNASETARGCLPVDTTNRKLTRELKEILDAVSTVIDKQIVLVIGNTGDGKSSLVNYLLGSRLKREEVKKEISNTLKGKTEVKEISQSIVKVVDGDKEYTKIGHEIGSQTQHIQVIKFPDADYYYCDCPGFGVNHDQEIQSTGFLETQLAFQLSGKIRAILVVVDLSKCAADNRQLYMQGIFNSVLHLLKNVTSDTIKNGLYFVGTKVTNSKKTPYSPLADSIYNFQKLVESQLSNNRNDINLEQKKDLLNWILKNEARYLLIGDVLDNGDSRKMIQKHIQDTTEIEISGLNQNHIVAQESKASLSTAIQDGLEVISNLIDKSKEIEVKNREAHDKHSKLERYQLINCNQAASNATDIRNHVFDLEKSLIDAQESLSSKRMMLEDMQLENKETKLLLTSLKENGDDVVEAYWEFMYFEKEANQFVAQGTSNTKKILYSDIPFFQVITETHRGRLSVEENAAKLGRYKAEYKTDPNTYSSCYIAIDVQRKHTAQFKSEISQKEDTIKTIMKKMEKLNEEIESVINQKKYLEDRLKVDKEKLMKLEHEHKEIIRSQIKSEKWQLSEIERELLILKGSVQLSEKIFLENVKLYEQLLRIGTRLSIEPEKTQQFTLKIKELRKLRPNLFSFGISTSRSSSSSMTGNPYSLFPSKTNNTNTDDTGKNSITPRSQR